MRLVSYLYFFMLVCLVPFVLTGIADAAVESARPLPQTQRVDPECNRAVARLALFAAEGLPLTAIVPGRSDPSAPLLVTGSVLPFPNDHLVNRRCQVVQRPQYAATPTLPQAVPLYHMLQVYRF